MRCHCRAGGVPRFADTACGSNSAAATPGWPRTTRLYCGANTFFASFSGSRSVLGINVSEESRIQEIISGHEARNASLRDVFLKRNVDLAEPRKIECHFWTWSGKEATELSQALKVLGFEELARRPAAIPGDANRWNLEAAIRQSIDLTMRREFIDELVRMADSHGGLFDGWGTSV